MSPPLTDITWEGKGEQAYAVPLVLSRREILLSQGKQGLPTWECLTLCIYLGGVSISDKEAKWATLLCSDNLPLCRVAAALNPQDDTSYMR